MLFESWSYADIPQIDTAGFDAAIVGLTFRHLICEAVGKTVVPGDMFHARPRSEEEYGRAIEAFSRLVHRKLQQLHDRLSSVPTFFLSFFEPSFNYAGNLLHNRKGLSPRDFVISANRRLIEVTGDMPNFYYVEMNDILNCVGRLYLHDDINMVSSHASYLSGTDGELEQSRITPATANFSLDEIQSHRETFGSMFWRTIGDNLKVLRQSNPVKLIVVDLDDTLWRGVAAEDNLPCWERIEGWPMGFVEALLYFKSRGGLLAICSKNDDQATRERLGQIWLGAITVDDFVSVKINWQPKAANLSEIIRETNILPDNILFIDDNPREIDEVRSRFPTMRCLGGNHYDWRRIIMRSPETQVTVITDESDRRTELVRAIAEREASATAMPREAWLRSLKLEEKVWIILKTDDIHFNRAFELINKTNQFNTTGRRWQRADLELFFNGGGVCVAASLKDSTGDNGLIAAALVKDGEIVQVVLSCRVFGLGAEIGLGRIATQVALSQNGTAYGRIIDTGKNYECHT